MSLQMPKLLSTPDLSNDLSNCTCLQLYFIDVLSNYLFQLKLILKMRLDKNNENQVDKYTLSRIALLYILYILSLIAEVSTILGHYRGKKIQFIITRTLLFFAYYIIICMQNTYMRMGTDRPQQWSAVKSHLCFSFISINDSPDVWGRCCVKSDLSNEQHFGVKITRRNLKNE